MNTSTAINAIATFFAAISAWAAYKTVQKSEKAAGLARIDREVEQRARRRSFRWRIVPALYQIHIEARTVQQLIEWRSDRTKNYSSVTAKDLRLGLPYAQRLFELEGELGILPESEARLIARAIETVRQYEAFIARHAPPESASDPFVFQQFPSLILPLFQQIKVATDEAIAPYQPGMPDLD